MNTYSKTIYMSVVRNLIPNLLTLGNLVCGLVAIVLLMDPPSHGEIPFASIGWLMACAMVFDFFDGFVAKALKATSPLGKELDSLSDLVSFGVLPGFMVYVLLKREMLVEYVSDAENGIAGPWGFQHSLPAWKLMVAGIGLIIPLFSAYRLAKFNIDTRQSHGFLGLPTPANALFFLSIFLVYGVDSMGLGSAYFIPDWISRGNFEHSALVVQTTLPLTRFLYDPWILGGLSIVFSLLLVTEIPLLAMKFKDYAWKGNWPRYVLILISVPLLAILWFRAIPLIIVLYFLLSFIDTRLRKS
jgi:CDP-diacylglycerol---serine O-phosphatidyltransferase